MNPLADLSDVFSKALERVDPYRMIMENVSLSSGILKIRSDTGIVEKDLALFEDIYLLGIGKASCRMALAIEKILGDRISEGVVVTKYGHALKLERTRVLEAAHPVPDENSVSGARIIREIAGEATGKSLIINLVSGGGSALFCLPEDGISLGDKQSVTRVLLECGADITEINCLRKHLSAVKGGKFARIAFPASTLNIILSDVIGDRLDTIASGIFVADDTTFEDAWAIVRKYGIEKKLPESVLLLFKKGVDGKVPDTPKAQDPSFRNVENILLGNNLAACRAAGERGRELGYNPLILTTTLGGEASEMGRFFAALARDIDNATSDIVTPALVVAGGETTVTLKGKGTGGRNQEMALAFLADMAGHYESSDRVFFLSAGTDGNDGPTDAAGAFVCRDLIDNAASLGLNPFDYLKQNDSYHFFKAIKGLLLTGPTNTNVCDIQLLIVTRAE